jgi:dTDP-4-dehydrorhamnose reductase
MTMASGLPGSRRLPDQPSQSVTVVGASGQLGSDLCQELDAAGFERCSPSHAELDIREYAPVAAHLRASRPSVIINLAAFHQLDRCEADPARAFDVNCHAVRNLAEVADELQAQLVHISTDYVFGGDQDEPYDEQSLPNPLQVYGVSKLAGEYFVRNRSRRHLLIRTSGLYGTRGSSGKGGNFVETMLRLGQSGRVSVVTDQVLSPTNTRDLSTMIVRLIRARATGLFHVTNSGSCSWFEFARRIFAVSNERVDLVPIPTSLSGSAVARPGYSVLENRRLKDEGFGLLRSWEDALNDYLGQRTRMVAAVT